MALEGVIIDGRVELDVPANLPNGTRVRLATDAEEVDFPAMPLAESYEEHLARLRESIAESKAGKTRPAREVLRELAIQHGLRLQPGE